MSYETRLLGELEALGWIVERMADLHLILATEEGGSRIWFNERGVFFDFGPGDCTHRFPFPVESSSGEDLASFVLRGVRE